MAGSWLLGPDTGGQGERPTAVLVAVRDDGAADSGPGSQTSLTELRRLAATDGLTVADEVVQRRPNPDPATYVGSGKVDELAALAESAHADLVIADRELTPGQVRNLEERVGVRVVDRTALILDIFAEHARTSEGRVQVELAQRATRLRRNASELARRRERTRTRRARNQVPSVSITGYTNAGKSALLNRPTRADAQVHDVLFATLDPTVRRISTGDLNYTVTRV
ncbi:GTPase HflX [Micromonospora noduli]|uniref:HflX-like GTP-binding protein n=1 Tax=Micromonospora noduli TaxID=709876 RepID=UPI000DC2849C|nr:GTPase [Micromonospora noduli]RAO53907.1 GTPase HflX [Micromonospora noduli]